MKTYQRKRRFHNPVVPIDIKRLYVKPGEILIVKVAKAATEADRTELMGWLGEVAPGAHVMITDQPISLSTVHMPPAPVYIDGPELSQAQRDSLDEMVRRAGMRAGVEFFGELSPAAGAPGPVEEGIKDAGLAAGGERPEGRRE